MNLHFIAGKSGLTKSVIFYHTNKNLKNFDPMITNYVDFLYDSDMKPGMHVLRYGAQNGYYEIGYTAIEIIAHSSNGRTPDSDSGYCGSNP